MKLNNKWGNTKLEPKENKLISICPLCGTNNFHQKFIMDSKPKIYFPRGETYNLKEWEGRCTVCGFKDGGAY